MSFSNLSDTQLSQYLTDPVLLQPVHRDTWPYSMHLLSQVGDLGLYLLTPREPERGMNLLGSNGKSSSQMSHYGCPGVPLGYIGPGVPPTCAFLFTELFLDFPTTLTLALDLPGLLVGVPLGRCNLLTEFSVTDPFLGCDRVSLYPFFRMSLLSLTGRYFTRFRGWVRNSMGSLAALFS